MAYPEEFEPSYDYTAFASGQGDNSFPGGPLDVDMASLQTSIASIVDFVSVALASDGTVKIGALPSGTDLDAYVATAEAAATTATTQAGVATSAATAASSSASAASGYASAALTSANTAAAASAGKLTTSNNLSELTPTAGTARTNLGLGALSTKAQADTSDLTTAVQQSLVPTGSILEYAGSTEPSGWLFCYGQSLLRSSYAALFTAIGTTYGAADGTHFNVPDRRGYVGAGKDDMGGSAAGRLNITMTGTRASTSNGVITALSTTANLSVGMKVFGTGIGTSAVISSIDSASQVTLSVNNTATGSGTNVRFGVVDGATLGDTAGAHTQVMTTAQMPLHGHPFRLAVGVAASTSATGGLAMTSSSVSTQNAFTGAPSGTAGEQIGGTGSGQAQANIQPTIILNYIIKT